MVAESLNSNEKYWLATDNQTAQSEMCLTMTLDKPMKQFGELKDAELCVQSEKLNKYGLTATAELAKFKNL